MQYRPPKKPASALLAASVFLASAASLMAFFALGIGYSYLVLPSSLLLFALSFYTVSRYVTFDCLYALSESYSEPSLAYYVYKGNRFCLVDRIEFIGKESLVLLDEKGKKAIKKLSCRKRMTSNLIPRKRYALIFERDGEKAYLLLELDKTFAKQIGDKIRHAKILFPND